MHLSTTTLLLFFSCVTNANVVKEALDTVGAGTQSICVTGRVVCNQRNNVHAHAARHMLKLWDKDAGINPDDELAVGVPREDGSFRLCGEGRDLTSDIDVVFKVYTQCNDDYEADQTCFRKISMPVPSSALGGVYDFGDVDVSERTVGEKRRCFAASDLAILGQMTAHHRSEEVEFGTLEEPQPPRQQGRNRRAAGNDFGGSSSGGSFGGESSNTGGSFGGASSSTGGSSSGGSFGGGSSNTGFGGGTEQNSGFGGETKNNGDGGFGGQTRHRRRATRGRRQSFGGETNGGFSGRTNNDGFGGRTTSNDGFGGQTSNNGGLGGQTSNNGGFGGQTSNNDGFGGQTSNNDGFGGETITGFGGQDSNYDSNYARGTGSFGGRSRGGSRHRSGSWGGSSGAAAQVVSLALFAATLIVAL